MILLLRRYARQFRVLGAITVCLLLLGVLVRQDALIDRAQDETIWRLTSATREVSEMQVEAGEYLTQLTIYSRGVGELTELQTQFEVLWSRVENVRFRKIGADTEFGVELEKFKQLLVDSDPVIFAQGGLSLSAAQAELGKFNFAFGALRSVWSQEFARADQNPESWFLNSTLERRKDAMATASLFLLLGLLGYLVAEIQFSQRAQRRERKLRLEADQANKAKSAFIANVSHEIRTPLNGILGMTSVLAKEDLTTPQRECLDVIEDSGGILLSTINDVLDLAKIEAGRMQLHLREFSPEKMLRSVRALYAPLADAKGVELRLVIDEDTPEVLVGDERRVRQALHNLVANAIKFTDVGHVTLSAWYNRLEPGLIVKVSDTGLGIPPEAQSRVFEPFGQAGASHSRDAQGTGLGLPISRQIIRSMGGDISLESDVGKGTEFQLVVPMARVPSQQARDEADVNKGQATAFDRTLSVLVVDDNKVNRLVLGKLLRQHNTDVSEAVDGFAALEAVKCTDFDLIFMDARMPRMGGIEATQAVLKHCQDTGRPTPRIIGVTANVLPEQVEQYRSVGMFDVLAKPVQVDAVSGTVSAFKEDAKGAGAPPQVPSPKAA